MYVWRICFVPFFSVGFFLTLNLLMSLCVVWIIQVCLCFTSCLLMCARAKVFVCLIGLSIRAQPLILSWPSLCSQCVWRGVCVSVCAFLASLSKLCFAIFHSFSVMLTVYFMSASPTLAHPSIPKSPSTDSTTDADKLQRGLLMIVGGDSGDMQSMLACFLSLFLTHRLINRHTKLKLPHHSLVNLHEYKQLQTWP